MSQQRDVVHAPAAAGSHDLLDLSSSPAARLLFTRQLRQLYATVKQSVDGTIWDRLLDEMKVTLDVESADLARVPATGPVVVVANHPFGILDGVILTAILLRVRPDVKVLANFVLSAVPELQAHCIYVDP